MKKLMQAIKRLDKSYTKFSENKITENELSKQLELVLVLLSNHKMEIESYFNVFSRENIKKMTISEIHIIEQKMFYKKQKFAPTYDDVKNNKIFSENSKVLNSYDEIIEFFYKKHSKFISNIKESRKVSDRKIKKQNKKCYTNIILDVLSGSVVIAVNSICSDTSGVSIALGSNKIIKASSDFLKC